MYMMHLISAVQFIIDSRNESLNVDASVIRNPISFIVHRRYISRKLLEFFYKILRTHS